MLCRNISRLLRNQLYALLGESRCCDGVGREGVEGWKREIMRYLSALNHFTSPTNANLGRCVDDAQALFGSDVHEQWNGWIERLMSVLEELHVEEMLGRGDLRAHALENDDGMDVNRTDSQKSINLEIEPDNSPVDATPAPSAPSNIPFTPGSPSTSFPISPSLPTSPITPISPTLSSTSLPDLQYPIADESPQHPAPNAAWPNAYNPQHRKILTTKWLRGLELTALGIAFNTGPYSAPEERRLQTAIDVLCTRDNLSRTQLYIRFVGDCLTAKPKVKSRNDPAWAELADAVGMRPLWSIFQHMQLPAGRGAVVNTGRWEPYENELLKRTREALGPSWAAIGEHVGRSPLACRQRYNEKLREKTTLRTGKWTKEEESRLVEAMDGLPDGRALKDDGVVWTEVAVRMGGTRTGEQCQKKWTHFAGSCGRLDPRRPRT